MGKVHIPPNFGHRRWADITEDLIPNGAIHCPPAPKHDFEHTDLTDNNVRSNNMLRVFKVTSAKTDVPVTVLADNSDDAAGIFGKWVEHRWPEDGSVEFGTQLIGLQDIALQPQLQDAVGRGAAGICYWLGHRAGYVVAGPEEPAFGELAPTETDIRCFVFNDGDELFVFAPTIEHAVVIWNEWNLTHHGERREFHTVEEMSRWLLQGTQVTLREDIDRGLAGVGSMCADGFWRVYPPEYEPPVLN